MAVVISEVQDYWFYRAMIIVFGFGKLRLECYIQLGNSSASTSVLYLAHAKHGIARRF